MSAPVPIVPSDLSGSAGGIDLSLGGTPWTNTADYWESITAATRHLDPTFGIINRAALAYNAHDMVRRAQGTPIRVASKSVRVRAVLDAVLKLPGFSGVLAFTLPEAMWLARSGVEDVVVAYPNAHRQAIALLCTDETLAERITIMIDDVAQLDFIDAVVAPARRRPIRVALDLDASLRAPLIGHVGVLRSPVRDGEGLARLARAVVRRPGFSLVGIMAYEAQIAGVGDASNGGVAIRAMQRASIAEITDRRSLAVALVREIAQDAGHEIEFVNGGGSGSIESTRLDPSITEIGAGSGLFGPHTFDHFRAFRPAPAAAFALSVVRKPEPGVATLLGGGWVASGPPAEDRLPKPTWPTGLEYVAREAAGEVQTPLRGDAARNLNVGDVVWMRHAKAGELTERLGEMHIVDQDAVVATVPTYRGEGKAFL